MKLGVRYNFLGRIYTPVAVTHIKGHVIVEGTSAYNGVQRPFRVPLHLFSKTAVRVLTVKPTQS
jgi:hypothetical protein